MPPFGGPLPALTPGPPHAGPAVAPHGAPGNASQGLGKVQVALTALQEALPQIPMGTELHEAVLKAVSTIGKHMTDAQDSPQMKMQNLLSMIQQMRAKQPNAALGAMGAPAGGAPPPAPPMMAPPSAPPGMAAAA